MERSDTARSAVSDELPQVAQPQLVEGTYLSRASKFFTGEVRRVAPDYADRLTLSNHRQQFAELRIDLVVRLQSVISETRVPSDTPFEPDDFTKAEEARARLDERTSEVVSRVAARPVLTIDARFVIPTKPVSVVDEAAFVVIRQCCQVCAGEKVVPCAKCKGKGEVQCKHCRGATDIYCPDCNGSGSTRSSSGSDETCRRCAGHRRVACPTCERRGRVRCRHCKGKKGFPCEACLSTGQAVTRLSSAVVAHVQARVNVAAGDPPLVDSVIEAFGGRAGLDFRVGEVRSLQHSGLRSSVCLAVPIATMTATLNSTAAEVVVAGAAPRVVDSGDLFRSPLAGLKDALSASVGRASVFRPYDDDLEPALRNFLSASPHRAAIVDPDGARAVMPSADVQQANDLVTRALRVVNLRLFLTRVGTAALACPLLYLLLHRAGGMSVLTCVLLLTAAAGALWASAWLSYRLFVHGLSSDRSLRSALLQADV